MDIEAGKTLTNEEVIREFLELLKKNAMKEQARGAADMKVEIGKEVSKVREDKAR